MRKILVVSSFFILLSGLIPISRLLETPLQAAPETALPLEGHDGDWTFRIVSSGFMPGDYSKRNPERKLLAVEAPAFSATFSSLHTTRTEPVDWRFNLRARIFSPQDVPVRTLLNGARVSSGAVDPKWPFVWVEFYGRDPYAADGLSPRAANGQIDERFTLEVPKTPLGQEVTVDKVFTSTIGSTFKVGSLTGVQKDGQNQLHGIASWTRPADAPETLLTVEGPDLLDVNDRPFRFGRIMVGGIVGRGQERGGFTTNLKGPPPSEVWKLRFKLQQDLPSRAVAAGRFKIRIKVPLSLDAVVLPNDVASQKPRAFTGEGFSGRIENDGRSIGSMWFGNLWTRDSTDPSVIWKIRSPKFTSPDGKTFDAQPLGHSKLNFHRDGSSSPAGEWAQSLMATMPVTKERPYSLTLDTDLEACRVLNSNFIVSAPIPKPGETLALDTDVRSEEGLGLTLIGARFYNDVSQIPGVRFADQIPLRGVALVFKATPLTANPARSYCSADVIRDSDGRPLEGNKPMAFQDCNALVKNSAAQGYFSAFITAPAPDAKSIELMGTYYEESAVLKTAKLHLEKVPVVGGPVITSTFRE